jgi:hypothetical protein
MHPYDHITEHPPSPPAPTRAALGTLRAARGRPARIATAVVGGQLCAVVLATEAPSVMGVTVAGPLNVGLALVLVQLGLAAWTLVWYGRYGKKELDPLVARHVAASRQRGAGSAQWEGSR